MDRKETEMDHREVEYRRAAEGAHKPLRQSRQVLQRHRLVRLRIGMFL